MEELPQKQNPEQLHTDEAPVQEPEYTLEEIMREFGGWTKREEEPAPKAPGRAGRQAAGRGRASAGAAGKSAEKRRYHPLQADP